MANPVSLDMTYTTLACCRGYVFLLALRSEQMASMITSRCWSMLGLNVPAIKSISPASLDRKQPGTVARIIQLEGDVNL